MSIAELRSALRAGRMVLCSLAELRELEQGATELRSLYAPGLVNPGAPKRGPFVVWAGAGLGASVIPPLDIDPPSAWVSWGARAARVLYTATWERGLVLSSDCARMRPSWYRPGEGPAGTQGRGR